MGQFLSDLANSSGPREESTEEQRWQSESKIERSSLTSNAKIYRFHDSVVLGHRQVVEEAKQVPRTADFRGRVVIPREDNGEKKLYLKAPKPERRIKHYSSCHKILLVGEGDFSFAACLAGAFDSARKMVATSLDSIGFLLSNYGSAMSNIHAVKTRGGIVLHGFDATEMADNPLFKGLLFDRIVFNFPLAGFFRDESRESRIRHNQELVSLYFKNAMKMISEDGEIHVSHKSRGFYLQWNLPFLAQVNGLRLREEVQFRLEDYPGYHNKYGFGGDKNFDCNPSTTYKFGLQRAQFFLN